MPVVINKYRAIFLACIIMFAIDSLCALSGAGRLLQLPSGWLSALFLGAPSSVDNNIVLIMLNPPLTVSENCSGAGFFAFLCGLGGTFICRKNYIRWLLLVPLCYLIALMANVGRITMAWHFYRFSSGYLPGWLQEYSHMGIGMACFLSITAVLLWFLVFRNGPQKEQVI